MLYSCFTELVFTAGLVKFVSLAFLAGLVLTILMFLTEVVLAVQICFTELVLTVMIFLTEVLLAEITFLVQLVLIALAFLTGSIPTVQGVGGGYGAAAARGRTS